MELDLSQQQPRPLPPATLARKLETDARRVLAADQALRPGVAAGTLHLYRQNEELPADPDQVRLPGVIVSASTKGWNLTLKVSGRVAQDIELKLECRVAGNTDASADALEQLAVSVRRALEASTAASWPGWLFLRIGDGVGDERGFSHGARVLSVLYPVTALI